MRAQYPRLLLLFLLGCTSLKREGDRPDAMQLDAMPDGTECAHRVPPAWSATTADWASRGSNQAAPSDLVFAVSRTDFGIQPNDAGPTRYQTIGFDLDNTCTGQGSCQEPSWANAVHHDGVDGIDNAFGLLLVLGGGPDSLEASADQTELLLRVRNYSGEPNDDQIEVSLYFAVGLVPRPDGSKEPLWDGQDRWTILPETLLPAAGGLGHNVDLPLFRADQAYVTEGKLVARFHQTLWPAGLTNVPRLLVTVRQFEVAGELRHAADAGGAWELHDLVAGMRIGVTDALTIAAFEPNNVPGFDSSPNALYCQDKGSYEAGKRFVCSLMDVTADPTAPASAACDAMSIGLLFQAQQALLGDVALPAPELPQCAPDVHPGMDSCETLADQ
jgi:hypothetical protein